MSEPDQGRKLADLEARIAAAKGVKTVKNPTTTGLSSAEIGWRMVTELVAGLGIGLGIGYGVDVLFGTLPWFLILFTGLGFVAGIRVMMRTAMDYQEKAIRAERALDEDAERD